MKKSNSEDTQGARLDKAQDVSLHIQSFANFNPPHNGDQAINFANSVDEFDESTISFALAEQRYRLATEERQKLYLDNEFSATKVLKYLRAIAEVHFGEESRQAAIIVGAINKMRPARKHKKKEDAAEAAEETAEAGDDAAVVTDDALTEEAEPEEEAAEEPRPISQSHRSYASMALSFRKVVEMIATIPYQSNTPELQIASLQQLAKALAQINREVALAEALKENARRNCKKLDEQVALSVLRIKSYVKYAYGVGSEEYLTVK